MLSLDYSFQFDECQFRVAEKKIALSMLPFSIREFHDIRARGGSKTFDTMIVALYLSSLGFEGIWFAAHSKQMKQPKKYLRTIIERSYLKYLLTDLLKESVTFKSGGELQIYNLTEDNARSPRADFVVYDELARAEEDAYYAASSILSVTQLGLIFNISTPCKATIEEERYEIIKRREIIHNEELVSELWWSDISFLARKKEWYEEQRRILPGWYFRQEHECSHELPMGAVFQNVIYDLYPDDLMDSIKSQPLLSGLDWNPVAGHWLTGGKWTPDKRGFVILHSLPIAVGYTHQLSEEAYLAIKEYCTYNRKLCAESGGINEEYHDWLVGMLGKDKDKRKVNLTWEEWDSQGVNKTNTILHLLDKTIYCDRMQFSTLAKQIEDCRWKADSDKVEIEKDPIDSPHALDAFLHAAQKKLMAEPTYRRFEWHD